MRPVRLALVLLAVCATAWAATPDAFQAVLPDGGELIVRPRPKARTGSLRLVFRAGANQDPGGLSGLAHLVEHVVFLGSLEHSGRSFLQDVRAAGGVVNAHTTAGSTTFELDAPAAAFPGLAQSFLEMVTDPALDRINLDRELGVVRTESDYDTDSSAFVLDSLADLLFPGQGHPSIIGTEGTRSAITRKDIEQFYEKYYTADRSTLVFTGAISVDAAQQLRAAAFRLPPSLPEERVRAPIQRPVLPASGRMHSATRLAAFGYALDAAHWPTCRSIAALLELRLSDAFLWRKSRASEVGVECVMVKKTPLLLTLIYEPTDSPGEVRGAIRSTIAGLEHQPPAFAEWTMALSHVDAERARVLASPASLANGIVGHASLPRAADQLTDLGFLSEERLDRKGVRAWLRAVAKDAMRVDLKFGPELDE